MSIKIINMVDLNINPKRVDIFSLLLIAPADRKKHADLL